MEEQITNQYPEQPASVSEPVVTAKPSGYCRMCGTPVFHATPEQVASGQVYCAVHAQAAASSPYQASSASADTTTTTSGTIPALAFMLGLLPGVGAVYNGQYAKGLIHAVIFGFLIAVTESDITDPIKPVVVMLMVAFFFYMPFEALHTARKKALGLPLDEFSGLIANQPGHPSRQLALIGPAMLILMGVLLLLGNLGVLDSVALSRFVQTYWPVLLILLGGVLLWRYFAAARTPEIEVRPEESAS